MLWQCAANQVLSTDSFLRLQPAGDAPGSQASVRFTHLQLRPDNDQPASLAPQALQCMAYLLLHMQDLAVFWNALDLVVGHSPQQGGLAGAIASN